MANTKISALAAATALTGAEAVPVVQTAATVQTTAASLLRQSAESVAVSTPRLNLTQSWTATTTKTLDLMNVDADPGPSNAASLLIDRQYLGVSKFKVRIDGAYTFSGGILASTDNTYDIGASGASRPRNIYAGTNVVASAGGGFLFSGSTALTTPGNGVLQITTAAGGILAVGSLPAAASGNKGSRSMVSDANATTFNSIVAAGGANIVPVFSDGTNWRIG